MGKVRPNPITRLLTCETFKVAVFLAVNLFIVLLAVKVNLQLFEIHTVHFTVAAKVFFNRDCQNWSAILLSNYGWTKGRRGVWSRLRRCQGSCRGGTHSTDLCVWEVSGHGGWLVWNRERRG